MLDYSVVYSAGDLPDGGHLLSPFNKMKRLRSKHRRFLIVFVKDKPAKNQAQSSFANLKIDAGAIHNNKENCDNDSCDCNESKLRDNRHSLVRAADYAFIELLQDIAKWLVIGFLLAVLISVALPEDFFNSFSSFGLVELLVVLVASMPLYMCATGSIPIAAVLLMKGVSLGPRWLSLWPGRHPTWPP